ncbi:Rab3 GTPase-activating protein catalytic subunit-domain-containing protein [Cokeromyces recurvatus]|uniref:Rab3 GTPase-activating protein catalytic subunit-domain-containing protein n=1 Tax=Cokeromyces recurvatus TaxID=90255 RepID=UPI0022200D20|nr:Rab3 GTPase-activating protein catalytic subunit-domain-containing protein [Cokeromyces recurvatus]KAI7906743.1 Rab3 GTPase-activating protein catalytic subunit-domain-containing protein [Cokeromyces recurvatus]
MTTNRRQSSSYSDDLSRYEFVDYTSVSHFEKFITQIEEALYAWGIKDGSFGIFSQDQLANAKAAILSPSAEHLTRKETLSFNGVDYQLSYHYHPIALANKAQHFPLAAEEFYQFSNTNYHPLHRWTGQERLLILQPSVKKKMFINTSGGKSANEMASAKQLLSACTIALQNAGCKIPVFLSVKQTRHQMYIGYMLICNDPGNPLNETEVRFNMSLITPSTTTVLWELDELKTSFLQKLSVHREDYGQPAELPYESPIYISAVYTYNLKNWFDENWKDWEEEMIESRRRRSFSDDFEAWDEQQAPVNRQNINEHRLPFGSLNDPLRSLTLNALFPLTDEFHYDYNTMDALTAKSWQLVREFAPTQQQRAYLSSLLEHVIESWVKDPTNRDYLAPFDSNNNESVNDSIGLMRNLFTAGNSPLNKKLTVVHQGSNNSSNSSSANSNDSITVIKSDQIEDVLIALFHSMLNNEDENDDNDHTETMQKKRRIKRFDSTRKLGLKLKTGSSVPYRSFLWNLLFYSLEAISVGSTKKQSTAAHFLGFLRVIWLEVLRQIRWHWENLVPIPDLNPYLYETTRKKDEKQNSNNRILGIDLRYNILHQKLSMINCCIYRRLQTISQNGNLKDYEIKPVRRIGNLFDRQQEEEEEKESRFSKFQALIERFVDAGAEENNSETIDDSVSFGQSDIENEVSDESDVFLDAVATPSPSSSSNQDTMSNNPMQESFVSLPYVAATAEELEADEANAIKDPDTIEGSLRPHNTLKLLKTGQPMQIPITQDPGFMTEDMISEQADVFESLGTSETATQQRAKLQSQQLFSDMQAFKAANPHACLEDFVRWHSPRDWITVNGEEGHLSTRMSEPNNIWQELWKCSKRVPCSRQKPLFNITMEAEKALYFLETTTVHEFFSIMLPTLGLIAYDTLSRLPIAQYSQQVANGLHHLSKELIEFPWDDFRQGKKTFDNILNCIRQQESMTCHAISLLRKLPRQYDLVDQLLVNGQAIVKEGDERSTVFQLFKNDQGIISEPSSKEYLLYNDCKDLTTHGRVLPQRQYTIVKDNEIRIVDMQTTDALYY